MLQKLVVHQAYQENRTAPFFVPYVKLLSKEKTGFIHQGSLEKSNSISSSFHVTGYYKENYHRM